MRKKKSFWAPFEQNGAKSCLDMKSICFAVRPAFQVYFKGALYKVNVKLNNHFLISIAYLESHTSGNDAATTHYN